MNSTPPRIFLAAFCSLCILSCTIVREYRPDRPFIFENRIKVSGIANREKLASVRSRLEEQIEDSARVVSASKIPWPRFPWIVPVPIIVSPNPYQPKAVEQSTRNMRFLMGSLGYKGSTVRVDSSLHSFKDQQRITLEYQVEAGRLFVIDTVEYALADSQLQRIADKVRAGCLLKKGAPFENAGIDQELDRLVGVFNNNGYQKFTREDIIVEADSTFSKLIDPSLDPFEFVRLLAEARNSLKNPTVDIRIRLNNIRDSTHLLPYQIGRFTVYSDWLPDADPNAPDIGTIVYHDSIKVVSTQQLFATRFIADQVEIRPGAPYTRQAYSQTLNNFNRLGAWQNINILSENVDSTQQINYTLRLTPAKRQFFEAGLEGSSIINNTQSIQVGSGRIGAAVNFTLRNRNLAQKAIQLENNLRTGVEFNNFQRLLTGEVSLTNRLTIPWLAMPYGSSLEGRVRNGKTITSADYSYIDRFKFFRLRTFNTFLGYEWRQGTNTSWQFRPLNFEYTRFDPDSLFLETLQDFPLLLYTYNNGLIIGSNVSYTRNLSPGSSRRTHLLRVYAEESGLLSGILFKGLTAEGRPLSTLYRFLKLDLDYRQVIDYGKSSLHLRFFSGYGLAFPTLSRQGQVTLPFFKSYVAGGPNSMRGWQLRKLGIGSNISFDTTLDGRLNDKYADIQLEGNLEYRFNLFPFYGFWMRGAAFMDVGNIWFRNDLSGQLPRAGFRASQFYHDLAMASGVGLRVDFSYFLLRFDLGFPIKDPRYGPQNKGTPLAERYYSPTAGGWFVSGIWNKPVFQFAIGYPF
ncbi:MAG: hypothetical protein FJX89_08195 [Bacteroidetes bacterium]|nr:hypothetical protein [Bacteroidota bacterium]